MVATTARRLLLYANKHNKGHIVDRNLNRLIMASYYYCVSRNNYFWDRVLFFTRDLEKRGPLIHRVMIRFLSKTSDSIRFVYSHVCSQTQWLLFRAERPRDKLACKVGEKVPLRKERSHSSAEIWRHITAVAQAMAEL